MTGMAVMTLRSRMLIGLTKFLASAATDPACIRHRTSGWQRTLPFLTLLMLLLCGPARANCSNMQGYNSNAGIVSFTPPTTIMLPNTQIVGTVLWTSSPITPTNYPTLKCSGNTTSGIINQNAGQPTGSDDTLFPTNVSGLSYRILHPDTSNALPANPDLTIASDGGYGTEFSVASALELVVTGTIAPGSRLNSGSLARWAVNNGSKNVAQFTTTQITFTAPACSIAIDPTVVTLPTVLASAFTGKGSTTGQMPFNVQLNCQAGANLAITLATANQQAGTTSVIAPTVGNGYASNVGVQLLDGHGNPISFGTAISEGTTPNGTMNLPFSARYYQTATGATAGTVTATATYTLTYQ